MEEPFFCPDTKIPQNTDFLRQTFLHAPLISCCNKADIQHFRKLRLPIMSGSVGVTSNLEFGKGVTERGDRG